MSKLQTLLEERTSIWEEMKTHLDAEDSEGRGAYDKAEKRFDSLTEEIEKIERFANRSEKIEKVDRSDVVLLNADEQTEDERSAQYREAFETYVMRGMAELDKEQRDVLRSGLVDEKRAQGIGTTTAGGYLVPEGFRAQIVERMKDYGSVQSVATVLNTSTGAALPWPTNDDTGNVGALLAENTQATEQDLVLGTAQLGAYKYTSKIVRVSLEFLQDVDWMDSEDFLRRKFAERLGRIHNQHFTTGTGTAQPQGIVTGATSGVTAASGTAITADELIDLQHSVDRAYRMNGEFMLSDVALKSLRKLKDANGLYLFQPNTQAGVPAQLAGSPYVINSDMAAPAVGVKSVLFGDFLAGYVIRLVKAFELIRLNERYADFGQVGFIAFDRADGVVQDSNAYRALTQAAV